MGCDSPDLVKATSAEVKVAKPESAELTKDQQRQILDAVVQATEKGLLNWYHRWGEYVACFGVWAFCFSHERAEGTLRFRTDSHRQGGGHDNTEHNIKVEEEYHISGLTPDNVFAPDLLGLVEASALKNRDKVAAEVVAELTPKPAQPA